MRAIGTCARPVLPLSRRVESQPGVLPTNCYMAVSAEKRQRMEQLVSKCLKGGLSAQRFRVVFDCGAGSTAGRQGSPPQTAKQGDQSATVPTATNTASLRRHSGKGVFLGIFPVPTVRLRSNRRAVITAQDGQYEWTRMPFGAPAPATQ